MSTFATLLENEDAAMSKQQLIEAIRNHNKSASVDFLYDFTETDLIKYLHHLRYINRPRGKYSVWVRPGDTAAIVTRHS